MKVVLDTNVFVSAVFFGGEPGRVLELWTFRQLDLVMSEEILSEYVDVLERLAERHQEVDVDPIVGLVVKRGQFIQPANLPEPVCADPDDDKFIAAAIGGQAEHRKR